MSSPERFSGVRGRLIIVAVVLLATVVLLALAESAIRVRQLVRHGTPTSYDSIYRLDDSTGLRVLRPGAAVGKIKINSLAFRGPEIPVAKPPNRVRIAFLGASTTFCAEVSSDNAVWTEGVIVLLSKRFPEVEFDQVNAGIPGYSVRASLDHYRHYVVPLQPDVVMIYHATNDMSGELRALAIRAGLWDQGTRAQKWFTENFLLWELVEKNLRVISARNRIDQGEDRLNFDSSRIGLNFRDDLKKLIDETKATATHVSIATFSTQLRRTQTNEEKKTAAVSALVYMPFMSLDGLVDAYERYNEVIRDVAAKSNVLLIGGENEIPADATHFVDTVHFSDRGSAAMATRVANALIQDPKFKALVESRRTK